MCGDNHQSNILDNIKAYHEEDDKWEQEELCTGMKNKIICTIWGKDIRLTDFTLFPLMTPRLQVTWPGLIVQMPP